MESDSFFKSFFDNDSTKDKIIYSALQILEQTNYQSMTTAAIAKRAKIAEGTIYRYFNSKKDILLAMLDEVNDFFVETFFKGIDNSASLMENFNKIGLNFFEKKNELVSLYKVIFKVFSEISDDDVKKKFSNIYERILKKIENLFSSYENPKPLDSQNIDSIPLPLIGAYFLWGAGELLWKMDIVTDGKVLNQKLIETMLGSIISLVDSQNKDL
jgi:AcrR family transcriptional regulator